MVCRVYSDSSSNLRYTWKSDRCSENIHQSFRELTMEHQKSKVGRYVHSEVVDYSGLLVMQRFAHCCNGAWRWSVEFPSLDNFEYLPNLKSYPMYNLQRNLRPRIGIQSNPISVFGIEVTGVFYLRKTKDQQSKNSMEESTTSQT